LQYGIQGSIDISKLSQIRFQINSEHDPKLSFPHRIDCTTAVNSNINVGPVNEQKQAKIERHHIVNLKQIELTNFIKCTDLSNFGIINAE